jgi:nitric oxide dioxygenase|eukprot:TRINITY_DN445_c0_g1_i1.p1 TRINITY_DN445_c0_g1~~TRINITY_DN445_c0_g1_i1.p1  ORF type:complete len:388 (+),score=51.51 TRINITY_DN445_c0_g1_i1:51-1166(+)
MSQCPFAEIVKATAPVVAPECRAIVEDFYPRMFSKCPVTKSFFNPANQFADPPQQRIALANAIVAYASNIEDLTPLLPAVELIAHKHCGLSVQPQHYDIVHENLMESISHVLGSKVVTEEIGGAWSEAVLSLAKILYSREEELYKMAESRQGGWRGVKDFKLANKRSVSNSCVEFTFDPVDGAGPIDFHTGQFLTLHLKLEGATPRHYTVTNKPGEPFLQCCVKKAEKGFVSNALHAMEVGELVGLCAPFGIFGLKENPAVLVSAGIGITPMRGFVATAPEKVRLALHVDKNEAAHPFKDEFANVSTHVHYTEDDGRPNPQILVEDVLQPHLSDCDFYLCGPPGFVGAMRSALKQAGAKAVYMDVFGPALA